MTLSSQFLDELRSRTQLSALVARSVKLTRAGREFKGCCPFHNEKTPSFYVNDEKGFYHCFGCGAHGDAIRWMTDHRGLQFIDAVKELAAAAGLDVPAPDPRAADHAERASTLHDVMAAAQAWFVEQLNGIAGADARAYLDRRGITAETARAFGIGFAPDSRGKLKAALAGYGEDRLIEAGLLISVEDKASYDRFRGRLMIPIRDPRGRVIAFGGRILGSGEPKYLNSPDTPLFDKGRTLYNLDRAAAAARAAGRLIVVEGYLDVIALAQADIGEAVAPLGTALTEHQIERLWRATNVPILCFDGDPAGQKAAARAARRALPMLKPGHSLDFVVLPDGMDPADMIESGAAAALHTALASNRKPLSQLVWENELAAEPTLTPEARAGLQARLDALASGIRDDLVRREYRATFRSLFWDTFGWGKKSVDATKSAVEAMRARPPRQLADLTIRAILWGLGKHPAVLRQHAEQVDALHVENDDLRRWRDLIVEAAWERPLLEESLLDTILAEADIWPIEPKDLTRDLAYSFVFGSSGDDKAARDLIEVIATLAAERELEIQLAQATERFKASVGEEAYVEQQRLRSLRDAKRAMLKKFNEDLGEPLETHQRITG